MPRKNLLRLNTTFALLVCACSFFGDPSAFAASLKTKNLFLITADGLRWQEVFRGAEETLMNKENGGVRETGALRRVFWRTTPEERRRALMPFFWSEIATQGQLYGNRDKGSTVRVTNGKNFSFPGYNELLVGYADSRIDSNDEKPNPNVNVLEWLNKKPAFQGRVAAFGCWDVFPYILNEERAGFPVQAGWEIVDAPDPKRENLNRVLRAAPRVWDNVIYDSFMFHTALDYVKEKQPRVVYLAFGETDDWAHDGRYDMYLHAARNFDRFIQELWETVQAMPAYKDQTTFLMATDHGRGIGRLDWKDHGESTAESAFIWIGVLGPDTPRLGERTNVRAFTQSQFAATAAAFLGEDYCAAFGRAAKPVADILSRASFQTGSK